MEENENFAEIIGDLQAQMGPLLQEKNHLHWQRKDHPGHITSNIISMYRTGELSDVIITVEGSHFLCHKMLLAASSPYFYAMFTSGLKESSMADIPIQSMKKDIFKEVLQYMYCGDVTIKGENVQGLLHASDILLLDTLKQGCVDFYQNFISIDNCLGIWQFSDQCNARILQQKSFKFALNKFTHVFTNPEFLELSLDNLCLYLGHEDLHVEIEDHICDAYVRWLEYSPETRVEHAMKILLKLRLVSQNARTIKKKLVDNKVIKQNKDAVMFLEEILGHLLYSEPLPKLMQLQPVRNHSQYPLACVILGGYTGRKRSKLCHVANYHENTKSISTSTVCEFPSQFNIEMASCVHNNIIYISGCGESSSEIWKLDMNRTLWTRCASLNIGRICHTMVTGPKIDECIFILGGYNQSEDKVLDGIEVHDINKNETIKIGQLAKPTACCAAQYYDGIIYTFGGVTEQERPSALMQMLNTETKQCTLLPIKLPVPSHRLRSILCIDKLIACGLHKSFIVDITQLHSIYKDYQTENSSLQIKNPVGLIKQRKGVNKDLFGLHLLGDKLLMFGGRILEDDSDLSNKIEIMKVNDYLCSDDSEWELIGRLPMALAMYTSGVVCIKNSLLTEDSGFTSL